MDNDKLKTLLLQLAHEIREEELKAMKFMCTDKLTKKKLEEIEDTTDLWLALEEADVINSENTTFLRKLLQQGCKNRADLIKIYFSFTPDGDVNIPRTIERPQNTSADTSCNENLQKLQKEFDLIVKEIGKDWRPLARKLRLSEADIDCIVEDNRSNLREQCRAMLKQWVYNHNEERQDMATKGNLIIALQNCEKKALANKVANI